ncbi:unnamed protein product [Amoebophrya sp. A25]|nr:unnamed protein product [Amoebophrya sp. A25]|eukprot:GSA25T00022777001.1
MRSEFQQNLVKFAKTKGGQRAILEVWTPLPKDGKTIPEGESVRKRSSGQTEASLKVVPRGKTSHRRMLERSRHLEGGLRCHATAQFCKQRLQHEPTISISLFCDRN